jgi:hypothetical protein
MDATKEQAAPVASVKAPTPISELSYELRGNPEAPTRDIELELAESQSLNRHLLEKISKAVDAVRRDQPKLALEILAG